MTTTHPRKELANAAWAIFAAFGAYFCMYAFRKPFTSGSYTGLTILGADMKTMLVTSQVFGYMVSKFLGIKVVSELPPHRRAVALLVMIGLAELALVGFAVVPAPWNCLFLFLNGLPLGMVFGLVLGFLEGRKLTEALTAGLCASFILADGVMKSVGTSLLQAGVSEFWMPAFAGALFMIPILGFSWMLSRIQPPTSQDMEARAERTTLNHVERKSLFQKYAVGLVLIVFTYLLVTILRSIRADFMPELWKGLGQTIDAKLFTTTEILVAIGVLVVQGSMVFIRNNRAAFFISLATCLIGFILLMLSLVCWNLGKITPYLLMVGLGFGLYLPYVAVHTTVFERLLAMTRDKGTITYLMYLADSFGYLGYVAVMLLRGWLGNQEHFKDFYFALSWWFAIISIVSLAGVVWFFARMGHQHSNKASSV